MLHQAQPTQLQTTRRLIYAKLKPTACTCFPQRPGDSSSISPPAAKRRRVLASPTVASVSTDVSLKYGGHRQPLVHLSKYCRRVRRLVSPFLSHIQCLAVEVQEYLSATWFVPCVGTNLDGAEVLAVLPFPLARPLEPEGYSVLATGRVVAESLAATNRSIQAMKAMQALVATGSAPLPPGLLLFQGVICRPQDSADSTKGFLADGLNNLTSSGADSLHGLAVGDALPTYLCDGAFMHLAPTPALLMFSDRTDSALAARQPWPHYSETHKTAGLRGGVRQAQRIDRALQLDTLLVHVFDEEVRRPTVELHVSPGAKGFEPLQEQVGRVTVTGPWHSVVTQKLIVDVENLSLTCRPIGTRTECGCVCVLVLKSSCR